MNGKLFLTAMVLVVACLGCGKAGGPSDAGEGLTALLPSRETIPSWDQKGDYRLFIGERLFDMIDGGADIFFEYGFDSVLSQEYEKGQKSVVLEVYRMKDDSAAFGIYSFNRNSKFPALPVGDEGIYYETGLSFWQGNYFIIINGFGGASEDELTAFARAVSDRVGATGTPPAILSELPAAHRVERSEVLIAGSLGINNQYYFAGNVLDIGEGAESVFATYELDGEPLSLLLVRYPTEEEAESALAKMQSYFHDRGTEHVADDPALQDRVFQDKKNRYAAMTRKGSMLALVLRARSSAHALALLREIE